MKIRFRPRGKCVAIVTCSSDLKIFDLWNLIINYLYFSKRFYRMKTIPFLYRCLILFAGFIFLYQSESCRKKDLASQVDFTIDLTDPRYSPLSSTGNYIIVNNVIIARATNGAYVAVSSFCTCDNTPLKFDPFSNEFVCSSDQSKFDVSGEPTWGCATQPLILYHVYEYGNTLRIYS